MSVSGSLMEDGPALMEAVDELKRRFAAELEHQHLVVVEPPRWHEDHNPVLDRMHVAISALTRVDPVWLAEIRADVARAVAEDQRWIADARQSPGR